MQEKLALAVVGTGVVGQGVLHAWRNRGYQVTGYDVSRETIDRLVEDGLDVRHMKEFRDCRADMVFICISTPQSIDGSIFLDHMRSGLFTVGRWIGHRVRSGHYPMIVMRSTMLPKLSEEEMIPLLEEISNREVGKDFGYAHLPEILRETDAIDDSMGIWQVVIGEVDRATSHTLEQMFQQILDEDSEMLISTVPVGVAESAKVIVNTYNATIISYFNQMNHMLNQIGVDGQAAIDLAVRMSEGSLNCWYGTSAGKPYGGKCLPKDVAAILARTRQLGLDMPQLAATQQVNDFMMHLAKEGKAPEPVKEGYRRASAALMRQRSIEAFKQYYNIHQSATITSAAL